MYSHASRVVCSRNRPHATPASVTTSTPHDALIRGIFSSPENASGQLRAVLPPRLAERIDWDSLHLESGHFVEQDLTAQYSDLLYSATLEGHPVLLYLLYEHQSSGDGMMPLRSLRYMVAIWTRWLEDNKGAKAIPAIVPVVLSNAPDGWRWPVSMGELFAIPDDLRSELQPYLPEFRFVLDDLMGRTDAELMARTATALGILGMLALRHGRDDEGLAPRLLEWAKLVSAVFSAENGREALGKVVRYALLANQRTTIQDLESVLVPILGEAAREVVMTEGERLIQQGELRGLEKGEAKGRAEGRAEGRAASVLTVLAARGMTVSDDQRRRIRSCSDIPTLDRWIVRAATAPTIDEVLAND